MQFHEPHQEFLVEEMRVLARRAYGPRGSNTGPVVHHLVNIDRIAKLHAIAHNPYHQLVFGALSSLDLMRICVSGLLESLDYRYASKVAAEIKRFEIEDARSPQPDQRPPPPELRDIFVLDIEAQPVVPPPLTEEEVYLRSLSDREIARQLKAAQKRRDAGAPPGPGFLEPDT